MGLYDFDYAIPNNFNNAFALFLQQNGDEEMAKHIRVCNVDINDVGYADYAGLPGSNWDKHAIDVTIMGYDEDIVYMRGQEQIIKEKMQKFIRPGKSGLLIRDIDFVVKNDCLEIDLPDDNAEESFSILSSDIHDAVRKNEPALVLDRLHTYSVRYIKKLCRAHSISIADDCGMNHPLHSLVGMLGKYYSENVLFQSEFIKTALKMNISVFERFNAIRNDCSYAHDNIVLNKTEAIYVISIITATLRLFQDIERNLVVV
ncbi:MAG TPA: hypothetical protein DCO86_01425 [Spirochaetaceae bacterium]|nr:hypothetical protein [Spirochaetaceae bacterium]